VKRVPRTAFDEVREGPGQDDPFPVYRRWRESAPVYPLRPGYWLLTRHEDVTSVLRDSRFLVQPAPNLPIPVLRTLFRMFKFLDPPDHRRLRHVVAGAFTPRAVAGVRPFVERTAAALLEGRTEIDVVRDFAEPIPIAAATEILGVPSAKRAAIGRWSITLLQALDTPIPLDIRGVVRLVRSGQQPPVTSLHAASRLRRYTRRALLGKIADRGPSAALDALVRAVDEGTLTVEDAAATFMVMLVGGMASTRGFISTAVYTLLRHPDQLDALRADPSLLPQALEELLRFDGPGIQVVRVAAEDVLVGDVVIAKGDMVFVLLNAANRDPAAFPEPDRLDICRPVTTRHVAFGTGIHYCPGDALSRLAGEVALAAIVPRLPRSVPDGFQPQWRRSLSVRELRSLPLELSPV
jgi:cytochrome P450